MNHVVFTFIRSPRGVLQDFCGDLLIFVYVLKDLRDFDISWCVCVCVLFLVLCSVVRFLFTFHSDIYIGPKELKGRMFTHCSARFFLKQLHAVCVSHWLAWRSQLLNSSHNTQTFCLTKSQASCRVTLPSKLKSTFNGSAAWCRPRGRGHVKREGSKKENSEDP